MTITTKLMAVVLFGLLLNVDLSHAQTGNYFSGTSAGVNNTTGDYNAFAGYGAGINNTGGSLNTAFGFYAGASNQNTSFNTSIGAYAGYFTSSSFGENVFVGYRAGFYNSNGFYNVMLGSNAGYVNNSGSYNVFIGASAGYDNTSGLSNTFIGYAAGTNNTTASANTFVGNLSGFSNTTGANNSFYGSGAGTSNSTGSNNSIFGSGAGYYNNASENTMMGYYAGRYVNTGYRNSFFGMESGMSTTTGRENTLIGRGAGRNNTTGSFNTFVGYYAQASSGSLNYSTAIGHKSYVRVSNAVVLGSINGENSANVTTRVGIGTSAPSYLLHVNGVAAKPGGGSWTVASDKNLKTDIQPFKEGLKEIAQINPVWFRYNGKAGLPTDKRFIGVIAQEMQRIAPHAVGKFDYVTEEGATETYLDFDANAMAFTLVNAVKELNEIAKTLSAEVQEQKRMIAKLESEIAALKKGEPLKESGGEARLWQNFPNPYRDATTIRYYLPAESASAILRVVSMSGQEMFTRQLTEQGESEIELSGLNLSSGNYVCELIVGGKVVARMKMIHAE